MKVAQKILPMVLFCTGCGAASDDNLSLELYGQYEEQLSDEGPITGQLYEIEHFAKSENSFDKGVKVNPWEKYSSSIPLIDSSELEHTDIETTEDACSDNPCSGAANYCMNTVGGYRCMCDPGYSLVGDSCRKDEHAVIRLMAANLTTGNFQSYQEEGIRIFQGLKPDIVMIQEFNYFIPPVTSLHKEQDIPGFVKMAFGDDVAYHRGTTKNNGDIPNGIISRYPIIESGTWEDKMVDNRQYEWARIDIPGDKDLWAVSVHLLTKDAGHKVQGDDLAEIIKKNVPKDCYIVIGGDFNTKTRNDTALIYLNDVVVTQASYYPADQEGNVYTSQNRDHTYDGVYTSADLHALETTLIIPGADYEYPHGLVFDAEVFTPLSAVAPIKSSDSHGNTMQHFPVLRDFKLW